MSHPQDRSPPVSRLDETALGTLARHALAIVASRSARSRQSVEVHRIDELSDALCHADDQQVTEVLAGLVANGVTSRDLCEVYAPAIARQLGEGWVDDRLSFAEVTVGAARLQRILRSYGNQIGAKGAAIPLGHSALIVIPEGENHSIGAFVAAHELRRLGVWVHMSIGPSETELVSVIQSGGFDFVGFTAGSRRSIAPLAALVAALRNEVRQLPPLVVGGHAMVLEPQLAEQTGCDVATTEVREALRFCGINLAGELGSPAKALVR